MEMTTVCSKKGVRANIGHFENRPFLEKMARGHRFGQKMKIFNPLRFHSIIVPTCQKTFDPV